MSIPDIMKTVSDSDVAVVHNVGIMLQVRGLTPHGFMDPSAAKMRWVIVGKSNTDTPPTTTDHMSARLSTIVFRSDEHFNGRDAHRLLQRCWAEADPLVQAEMIRPTEFHRHVIVLKSPVPKRKQMSLALPGDSPYTHAPRVNKVSRMDIFEDTSLRFNILDHTLVPVHRPLREHEIAALGIKYGRSRGHNVETSGMESLRPSNPVSEFILRIPRICNTDPVVRFMGGVAYAEANNDLSGTIYEITRNGYEVAYRRVVDDLGR